MTPSAPAPQQIAVVLAVKHLGAAKSRLAAVFPDARQRAEFVAAMLTDTLAAARAAGLTRQVVVSPDPRVRGDAESTGARAVAEPIPRGNDSLSDNPLGDDPLNDALRHGARHAEDLWRPARVLYLQADLPALRPGSLAAVIEHAAGRPAVFVSDHAGTGTAALLATPGFRPRFGPASAAAHRAAGAVELDAAQANWADLRCDVDTPGDLRRALSLGMGQTTVSRLTGEIRSGVHHLVGDETQ